MSISKFDFMVLETRGKMRGLANKSALLVLMNTNDSIKLFNEIMLLLDDYESTLNDAIAWHDYTKLIGLISDIHMSYKEIKDMLK